MIIKRLLFVAALVCVVSLNYSCGKEDIAEQEQDILSIKKSDVDDGDT